MRITTQMLNESLKEAGVHYQRSTLLDYVNGKKSGSTLQEVLSNSKSNSENAVKKKGYQQAELGAGGLLEVLQKMKKTGTDNVFDKAKESGDTTELLDEIESLVENYNNTLKAMKGMTGTLDTFYNKKLKEAVTDNRELLAKVGITVASDGSLTINKDKLVAADVESLEKLFGADGVLGEKLSYVANKIGENARANLENISNQYNAKGNAYSASKSKYDFLG